jgi:arsenite methyltransferase
MPATDSVDRWAQWLLRDRHAGDPEILRATLEQLAPIRDRVLENAGLQEGDVVLDIGAGMGMMAFAALERVGKSGRVIFLDTSQELLNHCRRLAEEIGAGARCDFVFGSADDLAAIPAASVDVVTTRSVVMYVAAKDHVFQEFHRVLKPDGRVSMYERVNRFSLPEPAQSFWGYDATPIQDLLPRVRKLVEPSEYEVMLNFDERDLLAHAERAGFTEAHLEYHAKVTPREPIDWNALINGAQPPPGTTLSQAIEQSLTAEEADSFIAHLRPLVEAGIGTRRWAAAYLSAVKREG